MHVVFDKHFLRSRGAHAPTTRACHFKKSRARSAQGACQFSAELPPASTSLCQLQAHLKLAEVCENYPEVNYLWPPFLESPMLAAERTPPFPTASWRASLAALPTRASLLPPSPPASGAGLGLPDPRVVGNGKKMCQSFFMLFFSYIRTCLFACVCISLHVVSVYSCILMFTFICCMRVSYLDICVSKEQRGNGRNGKESDGVLLMQEY